MRETGKSTLKEERVDEMPEVRTVEESLNTSGRPVAYGISELEYLTDMLPQMRKIALGLDQKTLGYLLELSMIEARLQLDVLKFQESVIEMDEPKPPMVQE